MKFAATLATTLFATAITAAPRAIKARQNYPTITVSVINDVSGAHAPADIIADGTWHPVTELFSGSAIDNSGTILATSAMMTKMANGAKCSFNTENGAPIYLDTEAHSFAALDNNPNALCTVVLNDFFLECHIE